ncbi:MAG: YitT family protein [Hungatella sp.]|nr:YitT family protein [Hungatella sp.]
MSRFAAKKSVISGRQAYEASLLLTGSVLYGLGTHCFISTAKVAPGGASGIALMINHITGAPIGTLTLFVNLPLLGLAWFYLSKKFVVKTAAACGLSSLILDLLIAPYVPVYTGDRLLSGMFGGVLVGLGMAFVFLSGCTTGGSDIVGCLIQKKKPHLPIGRVLLGIDGVLLVVSVFVFGNMESGLFGLISLFIQSQIIDGIIYGMDMGNMATIVTTRPREISARIISDLERSATILPGYGAYSEQEVSVLLCAIRKSQFHTLKQIVRSTDPAAFVMVSDTSSVYGEGFKDMVS